MKFLILLPSLLPYEGEKNVRSMGKIFGGIKESELVTRSFGIRAVQAYPAVLHARGAFEAVLRIGRHSTVTKDTAAYCSSRKLFCE